MSITKPRIREPNMSTLLELERMQQHVARLRRRIKNQTRYLRALEDYPDRAKRASDVLGRDNEKLRCALIQLEDLRAGTAGNGSFGYPHRLEFQRSVARLTYSLGGPTRLGEETHYFLFFLTSANFDR